MAVSALDKANNVLTLTEGASGILDRVKSLNINYFERVEEIHYWMERLQHHANFYFRNIIFSDVECKNCGHESFVEFKGGYIMNENFLFNYHCEGCGHDWSDIKRREEH